jgi:aspartate carbamoyltransferase regulatory subunit
MRLFSTSVSRLFCTVKIEQINGKIVCLTDYIIRVILYTVHNFHQKDNINMDFIEMECEDVKWIQLMQPSSLVNMVLNVSVA